MASSGIQDFRFVPFEAYQLSTPSLELNNKGNILDKHSICCLTWEKMKLIQACTLEKYEIHLCCLKKNIQHSKIRLMELCLDLLLKYKGLFSVLAKDDTVELCWTFTFNKCIIRHSRLILYGRDEMLWV